jgi:hypothetical protein
LAAAWLNPCTQGTGPKTPGLPLWAHPSPLQPGSDSPAPWMTSPPLPQPPRGSRGVRSPRGSAWLKGRLPPPGIPTEPPTPRGGRGAGRAFPCARALGAGGEARPAWGELSGGRRGRRRVGQGPGARGAPPPRKRSTGSGGCKRGPALSRGGLLGRAIGREKVAVPIWSHRSQAELHSVLPASPHLSTAPSAPRGAWRGPPPLPPPHPPCPPTPHTHARPRPQPGWCSRRRWAASNAALGAIAALPSSLPRGGEAPGPARRGPGLPVQPPGGFVRPQLRGAAAGRAAGCSRAPRSTMAGRAGPAQSRRAAHSAAPRPPPPSPPGACIFFFFNRIHFFPPLPGGWLAGLPRLCPASHPGCCMGSERSPSASGSRRARAGRAAGQAARGLSLRLALRSRRLARPPSR